MQWKNLSCDYHYQVPLYFSLIFIIIIIHAISYILCISPSMILIMILYCNTNCNDSIFYKSPCTWHTSLSCNQMVTQSILSLFYWMVPIIHFSLYQKNVNDIIHYHLMYTSLALSLSDYLIFKYHFNFIFYLQFYQLILLSFFSQIQVNPKV